MTRTLPRNLSLDHCPEQWSGQQIDTLRALHESGLETEIYGQGIGSNAMFIRYRDAGWEGEWWLNPTMYALITPNGETFPMEEGS